MEGIIVENGFARHPPPASRSLPPPRTDRFPRPPIHRKPRISRSREAKMRSALPASAMLVLHSCGTAALSPAGLSPSLRAPLRASAPGARPSHAHASNMRWQLHQTDVGGAGDATQRTPPATAEEDLELTRKIILDHVSGDGGATRSEGSVSLDVATPLDMTSWRRLVEALPKGVRRKRKEDGSKHTFKLSVIDDLDRQILGTALPSMLNLAVVPVVNSVDTFWVGRLGSALALAGQAAANQAFFTLYFLVAFLPTITAPLVAAAISTGDEEAAQSRVCESLFLSNVLGGFGTLLLVAFPTAALGMVLPKGAPAMEYAAPYLRLRSLSMIPALFSATGFAAYRGMLNTVTPLKVSLATNLLNLLADPLFMFGLPIAGLKGGIGVAGAALATALAETTAGCVYFKLLLKRKLVRASRLLKPPAWASLKPLLQGGMAMLARSMTLNLAFLSATRRAQSMDPTGVSGAAYGICMQIYSMGVVAHLAVQGTAAALVPSAMAAAGTDSARSVADRIFVWGSILGVLLAGTQLALLPTLVPMFSSLPEVQEAIRLPALISSFLHILNGPVFAGEGTMLGLGSFKALAALTAVGVGTMVGCLATPMGKRLDGILLSLAAFCACQSVSVLLYHLRIGPLRRRGLRFPWSKEEAAA